DLVEGVAGRHRDGRQEQHGRQHQRLTFPSGRMLAPTFCSVARPPRLARSSGVERTVTMTSVFFSRPLPTQRAIATTRVFFLPFSSTLSPQSQPLTTFGPFRPPPRSPNRSSRS